MRSRATSIRTRGIVVAILFFGAAALVFLFGVRWAESEAVRARDRLEAQTRALLEADAVRAARGLERIVTATREGREVPGVDLFAVPWIPSSPDPDRGRIFGDAERAEFIEKNPDAALRRYRALLDGTLAPTDRVTALRNVGRILIERGEEEEGVRALDEAAGIAGAADDASFLAAFDLARRRGGASLVEAIETGRYPGVTPEQRVFVHGRLDGDPARIPGLAAAAKLRTTNRPDDVVAVAGRLGWRVGESGGVIRIAVVEEPRILGMALPDTADWTLDAEGYALPAPFPDLELGPTVAVTDRIDAAYDDALRGRTLLAAAAGAIILLLGATLFLVDRRAASLEARKDHFLASVTHELKTPLANIRLYAETIATHGRDDPDSAERFAGIIDREAGKLAERVAAVLAVAAGGRPAAEPSRTFDLGALLESIAESHRDAARQRGVSIELNGTEGFPVRGPESLLGPAITAVVDNAVKFASSRVRVGCRADGAEVRMDVEDDGPGIPMADRERVFLPFERLEGARRDQVPGTGLGLPLARQGVEQFGGTVRAGASGLGGACLTLSIPAGG